jgi:hypothetical protein
MRDRRRENQPIEEKEAGREQIEEVQIETPHPGEGENHVKAEEVAYKNKDTI